MTLKRGSESRQPWRPDMTERLISTPGGSVKMEFSAVGGHKSALVTSFDGQGWVTGFEGWHARSDGRLEAFLARVTGLGSSEAQRHASELVARWRDSGRARRERLHFLLVMGGTLVAGVVVPALLAAVITGAVLRRRRTSLERTAGPDLARLATLMTVCAGLTRTGAMRPIRPPEMLPVAHVVPTPRGMAEVDIRGSRGFTFVTGTLFDAEGWAVSEEHWDPAQDDPLDAFLARVTGVDQPEAERLAAELVVRVQRNARANQEVFDSCRRMFLQGVVWFLAQAGLSASVAVLGTRAVMRRRLGPSRRRTG